MQLAVTGYSWCNFFSMYNKRLYFDKTFWLVNKHKLEIFYSKVVVKEHLKGNVNTKI